MKGFLMALVLVAACAVAYLAYRLIDAGISLDHSRTQAARLTERSQLSLEFVNLGWKQRSEPELLAFAKQLQVQRSVLVKREEGALLVGDLKFELANGKILSVSYLGEQ